MCGVTLEDEKQKGSIFRLKRGCTCMKKNVLTHLLDSTFSSDISEPVLKEKLLGLRGMVRD